MSAEYSCMLLPRDLEKLQAVFDKLRTEQKLLVDCEDAELLAARLIELYQGGVRDTASLRAMITIPPAR